ncbi:MULTISPECIES: acyl--CoA ligase family protein [unclassified Carboxydocella]|uniref:acyl--CoA ligase family protein n=1 Tax=unclassified Carboxydocella TaxID=2685367 RepID=UPI0009ABFB65|nr:MULTISPECIES: acyl--CoA ligase family protein [unclassified Carboxydocella]GAW29102.1 acyl-CoA synthetase [Carboxydocella sp. ULO1]GAW31035.1 acyl-CoA synthetase [Carboxydocella sp. JDF658]
MGEKKVYYAPLTPLSFLKRSLYVFPEKTAVVYNDRRYTYREFAARVNRLASALKSLGIEKGDRVAFLCPNIPPMLEAHYGVPLAGGALLSLNIRLVAHEIKYILNHSEAKVLFFDAGLAHVVEPIMKELPAVQHFIKIYDGEETAQIDVIEYEEFLARGSEEEIPIPVEDELEMIALNYTSGTTGLPKGVMYSHRGAYLNALGEALEAGMNSRSVYLWTLPMFHCNGWCFTWAVTAVGGTHVCLRKVEPDRIFELLVQERVTHLCAAPTVLVMMTNHPRAQELKLEQHLRILTAGAPPSPTVIKNAEAMGAEVIHVYGMTETYGPHTLCEWKAEWDELPAEERARLKARQGVPYITSVEMMVVNKDMQPVPRDGQTMGEIVFRGNNVNCGYFKDPQATALSSLGGWFHSGDLAVVHPDGYIEIKDRGKDIIISGGENISTVEVENVIYQHPAVMEVAVVAIPDEKWGEVPKAFVTLKPGMTATEEEIIVFCRERMARFKCPKKVEFGELPKTGTGKILKYILREKEWAGRERRVN